jgi:large subunit ribosomal protein L21
MYAIVNIAGQQYKVEKDQKLFVHRLAEKEGESVSFEEVLLIDNDKNVLVGEPTIKGAMISGKVISHLRGDKISVFKKKRRKGYKVLTGHRQYLTEIQIEDIIEKSGKSAATAKPAASAQKPAAPAAGTAKSSAPREKKPAEAATTAKTIEKPTDKPGTAAEKKASDTAAKKPAAKTSAGKPAADKTTAKKPAAKKPAAKKSTTTKTSSGKPAADKTAAKKPAAKKSAAAKKSDSKTAADHAKAAKQAPKKPGAGEKTKE